ncbi:MAG: GntR family transcriptional regulator, partial [Nocardioidaceae bacterium]
EKLPTVRRLATDLDLAANTVARAYRELEADRVIATRGRRGTFVRSEIVDTGGAHATAAHHAAAAYTSQARRQGLSLPEALRMVESSWPR